MAVGGPGVSLRSTLSGQWDNHQQLGRSAF